MQHETAYDYSSAIHTLEQVPAILHGTSIPGQSLTAAILLKRVNETQSEVHRLDELIRQRGAAQRLNGLLQEVNSLLKLCPDRSDLQRVKAQLTDRDAELIKTRDESIATAQRLVENQDYAGVIKALAQVDASVQTEEVTRLSGDASKKLARLEELRKTIKEATAGKQLHGLLKQVDECLSLKSDDEEMRQLQARLRAREEKNAAQLESIVQKACSLRDTCQFANAVKTLARIPQELITDAASDLLEFCQSAAVERSNALEALRRSQTSEDYSGALKAVNTYSNLISGEMLDDSEFQVAFQSCKQALQEQKGEEEASIKRKAFQIKMLVGTSAVIAVSLLVAAGLWIRSSLNASALAAEQQRQTDILAAEQQRQEDVAAAAAEKQRHATVSDMKFKLLPGGPDGAFSIGLYEVTQQQYEAVMGSNPSNFKGANGYPATANNPVEMVSWDDAVAYCAKLSSLPAEVAAGRVYRLPTAAEWEYACRAGTTTEYSFGDDEQDFGKYAWFEDNSRRKTHAVGEKLPNGWGLYDMHGNVYEWCSDVEGSDRVRRGGSYEYYAALCRSASRREDSPSYRSYDSGFRLALSSPSGIPQ